MAKKKSDVTPDEATEMATLEAKIVAQEKSEAKGAYLTVKATSPEGAMVKLPTADEAVPCPIGTTELDGLTVVVTP